MRIWWWKNGGTMSESVSYRAELLARLRAVTDDLAWAVRDIKSDELYYAPEPPALATGQPEWSMHEHLSHLRDMEQEFYLPLLRWAHIPEMLEPKDYSRREWRERRYRRNETAGRLIEDLNKMREEEFLILREVSDAAWMRYRTDSRWGPVSTRWLTECMYRHALDHLQGIMALVSDIHLVPIEGPHVVSDGYIGGTMR